MAMFTQLQKPTKRITGTGLLTYLTKTVLPKDTSSPNSSVLEQPRLSLLSLNFLKRLDPQKGLLIAVSFFSDKRITMGPTNYHQKMQQQGSSLQRRDLLKDTTTHRETAK